VPYVLVRAPAFLDQSADYVADGVKAGRFHAIGDKATKWSYVLTHDLASHLAKAATYHGNDIINQTIDIMKRRLAIWVVPWLVFRLLARPVRLFSELGYDFIQMFLFFRKGGFVANISSQERFFGPAPTSRDAITRWARSQQFIS
jgi:hypothetical protein